MDLRLAVQTEFIKRCRKNSAYSLRAYARFLEMDQSLLSKIMRDQRKISKKAAQRIGRKLGLKLSVIEGTGKVAAYYPLADDEFAAISEWYHFGILELLKTKDVAHSPAFIAKRLGIHVAEAQAALERLQRLGLVRIEKKRITLTSKNNSWSNNQVTTEARKLLQMNLLEKSREALESVPFSLRDHGSLTLAIDKKRIPELKEKLRQIRLEIAELFQADSTLDEVYQLQIAFYPLTKATRNPS